MTSEASEHTDPTQTRPPALSTGKNMLWNSFGSITFLACQWLVTILVVRLSPNYDAAGILALTMSVYNTFAPLAIYRMYTYQVSDVERENSIGEYMALRAITCGMAFICCIAYGLIACSIEIILPVVMYVLFKTAGLLIDVLHGEDQLNDRMDYIGISLILQGIGSAASFCAVFVLTQNITLSVAAMGVATIAVGLLYDLPHTKRFCSIKFGITRRKALRLLASCLPIVIATVLCSAVPNIPRQYLAAVSGDAALGIYASVAAPVAIIQMGASYIYNPLLSKFARKYHDNDSDGLVSLLIKASVGIVAIGAVGAVALAVIGPWLLVVLFGESIAPYTYLLLPTVLLAATTAFMWFLNDLLVALRVFSGSVVGNVASILAVLAVTMPAVALWGMNGVSYAGAIAYIAGVLIMFAFLARTVMRLNR